GAADPQRGGGGKAATTLRVDQGKVDHLMDLVGELIVAAHGLPYLAEKAESPDTSQEELVRALKEQHSLFDRLARELQGEVMQVRMLPVSTAFQRFPRLVRDLARQLGKEVRLEMSGEHTEADKQILDQLGEPLVHVVRNSLDHGLEPAEERTAAGKDPCGTVRLQAFPESERIVIQVEDDGRGIDPARVKAKAVERGIITDEEAGALGDREAVALVLRPGFSTAEAVSDVSGRGVGMDAVRSMVEGTGGTLAVENREEGGTRVRMALPMSMAVTRVLLVDVAGQQFGIPFPNVLDTLRVDPGTIHGVKHHRTLSWRGRFIPLVDLAEQLGKEAEDPAGTGQPPVLVARVGAQEVAFLVGDFHSGTDVVVKPLAGLLEGTPGVAGTGVLGDGSVLLVLALEELV
ncbi:MAG TPA: chemotaxis protein CheA, partial [Gammaproteobacteria bacterium]|nr:chemotaxis protein CheA [Gammaproteobacteria bacterium]